jgi:pimeloyl-ACP methyl ester carboxylesterase
MRPFSWCSTVPASGDVKLLITALGTVVASALVFAGCGDNPPGPGGPGPGAFVSDTVRAEGVTLTLEHGASLVVPPNAIQGAVRIQFAETTNVVSKFGSLGSRGYTLRFTVLDPHTTFSPQHSVRITMPIDSTVLPGNVPYIRAVFENIPLLDFWAPATLEGSKSLALNFPASTLTDLDSLTGSKFTLDAEQVHPEPSPPPPPISNSTRRAPVSNSVADQVGCFEYPLRPDPQFKLAAAGDVALVLVHGWLPDVISCDDFLVDQDLGKGVPGEIYLAKLRTALSSRLGASHPAYVFTYLSSLPYSLSGSWLASRIQAVQQQQHLAGVILIGHSMGGLVARQAVSVLKSVAELKDLPLGVISLGTPHLGTPLPNLKKFGVFFAAIPTDGTQSLLPENAPFPAEEAPLYAYGGDLTDRIISPVDPAQVFLQQSSSLLLCAYFAVCRSDGVVGTTSAIPVFIKRGRGGPLLPYAHSELHEGYRLAGKSSDQLYDQIVVDIEALAASRVIFSVNLTPSPPSGTVPLTTLLSANVLPSGASTISASGVVTTMNYTFWWNCSDPGTSVSNVTAKCGDPTDPALGAKFNAVTDNPEATVHTYSAAGTYTAKVIVERGSAPPAQAGTLITAIPVMAGRYTGAGEMGDATTAGQLTLELSQAGASIIGTWVNSTRSPRYGSTGSLSGTVIGADAISITSLILPTLTSDGTFCPNNLSGRLSTSEYGLLNLRVSVPSDCSKPNPLDPGPAGFGWVTRNPPIVPTVMVLPSKIGLVESDPRGVPASFSALLWDANGSVVGFSVPGATFGAAFTWTSSNPAVAEVNQGGDVKTTGYGTTVITATSGISGTAILTVSPP